MSIFENPIRPRWSLAGFAAALRARRNARVLSGLSDSQLEDIGVSRSDIGRVIRGL